MAQDNNSLKITDFSGPLSKGFGEKVLPLINRFIAHQAVAATGQVSLTHHGCPVQIEHGKLSELFIVLGGNEVPGAGESMVADVEVSEDGGATWASILSSAYTLDSTITDANARINLMGRVTIPEILAAHSRLRANFTYVAGGTPTPIASTIVVAGITPIL